MQRTRILVWIACALGLVVGAATFASAAPQGPQGGGRRGRPMSVQERLQRLSERLNLTDEQRAKLRPILQEQVKELRALREDQSLSPEDRRERRHQINVTARKQIGQILTPEQKEKWREMREENRERMQQRRQAPPQ